jgi:hypothetical protein
MLVCARNTGMYVWSSSDNPGQLGKSMAACEIAESKASFFMFSLPRDRLRHRDRAMRALW